MVTCECTVERAGDVALVGAVLTSTSGTARQVTVAASVDGPVWPPRRNGVPERPWSDGEVTVRIPADDRVPVGIATPADPARPPLEVVDDRRADDETGDAPAPGPAGDRLADPTPAGIVRALGDGRPPRDAVPEPVAADPPDAERATASGRRRATRPRGTDPPPAQRGPVGRRGRNSSAEPGGRKPARAGDRPGPSGRRPEEGPPLWSVDRP